MGAPARTIRPSPVTSSTRRTDSRKSALVGPEVEPIHIGGNPTCADLLDDPDIAARYRRWLNSDRPARNVLFATQDQLGVFLLDWKTAESLPWGVLLLFGGGLSLEIGGRHLQPLRLQDPKQLLLHHTDSLEKRFDGG